MIDYKKLKLAHEMCEAYMRITCKEWIVQTDFYSTGVHPIYYLRFNDECLQFNDIDDLITKLTELTTPAKPESKYQVGNLVFVRHDQDIKGFVIDEIIYDDEFLYLENHSDGKYSSHNGSFDQYAESELYPTKAELIEAQIAHWQSFKEEEIKHPAICKVCNQKTTVRSTLFLGGNPECQHEWMNDDE